MEGMEVAGLHPDKRERTDVACSFDFPSLLLELQTLVALDHLDIPTAVSLGLTSCDMFEMIHPLFRGRKILMDFSESIGQLGYTKLFDFFSQHCGWDLPIEVIALDAIEHSQTQFIQQMRPLCFVYSLSFYTALDSSIPFEVVCESIGRSGSLEMLDIFATLPDFRLDAFSLFRGAAQIGKVSSLESLFSWFEQRGEDVDIVRILFNACFVTGNPDTMKWLESQTYLSTYSPKGSDFLEIEILPRDHQPGGWIMLSISSMLHHVRTKDLVRVLSYLEEKGYHYKPGHHLPDVRDSRSGTLLRFFLDKHRQLSLDFIHENLEEFAFECHLIPPTLDGLDYVFALIEHAPAILNHITQAVFEDLFGRLDEAEETTVLIQKIAELHRKIVEKGVPMPKVTLRKIIHQESVRRSTHVDFSEVILTVLSLGGSDLSRTEIFEFMKGRKCSRRDEILEMVNEPRTLAKFEALLNENHRRNDYTISP